MLESKTLADLVQNDLRASSVYIHFVFDMQHHHMLVFADEAAFNMFCKRADCLVKSNQERVDLIHRWLRMTRNKPIEVVVKLSCLRILSLPFSIRPETLTAPSP